MYQQNFSMTYLVTIKSGHIDCESADEVDIHVEQLKTRIKVLHFFSQYRLEVVKYHMRN